MSHKQCSLLQAPKEVKVISHLPRRKIQLVLNCRGVRGDTTVNRGTKSW